MSKQQKIVSGNLQDALINQKAINQVGGFNPSEKNQYQSGFICYVTFMNESSFLKSQVIVFELEDTRQFTYPLPSPSLPTIRCLLAICDGVRYRCVCPLCSCTDFWIHTTTWSSAFLHPVDGSRDLGLVGLVMGLV